MTPQNDTEPGFLTGLQVKCLLLIRDRIAKQVGPNKGACRMAARIGISVAFLWVSGFQPVNGARPGKMMFGNLDGLLGFLVNLREESRSFGKIA